MIGSTSRNSASDGSPESMNLFNTMHCKTKGFWIGKFLYLTAEYLTESGLIPKHAKNRNYTWLKPSQYSIGHEKKMEGNS